MGLRQELEENGINPDATNDQGYECKHCGYEPTNIELQRGSRCPCQVPTEPE